MKPSELPPIEFLNECFTYCPETGKLFWKERPAHHFKPTRDRWFKSKFAGKEAGHEHRAKDGSPLAVVLRFKWFDKDIWLLAHRVIYALMGVAVPDGMEIDHRDRNPFNNAWTNLRLGTRSQNMANQRVRKGRSLPKGVWKKGDKFVAVLSRHHEGKKHLGVFATPEQASAAYFAEATKVYGEFARQN